MSQQRRFISAGHPLAVRAGLRALEDGGTAIDGAVAAAFASFVAEPQMAGIGGYGHLSAFLASERSFLAVDHGPRAPGGARADMFEVEPAAMRALRAHDWPTTVGDRNSVGHLAPAVPGAVAGLWAAHRAGGRLPWATLIEPAIAIADSGIEVTWSLLLAIAGREQEIRSHPALAAIVLPHGRLPRSRTARASGERLAQRELAQTLRLIAADGPDALYRGPVAERIAAAVGEGGGVLSEADLDAYEPRVVAEEPARYRDLEYVTCCDTVGYEALGILERFPLSELGRGTAEHYHLLAEAMGHAFADNATYWSDSDHSSDPVAELGGRPFASARAAGIVLDRAAPRPVRPAAPWPVSRPRPLHSAGGVHGTTQVVAADAEGNLASLITTIGGPFGSLVAVPGTGIVLNNSMVNYDPRPGRSNSIAPGKMPFFAVPAIVATRSATPAFAAAGSGGYPILAGVINTLVNWADHGLPIQAAIDEPRVHSQGDRTFIDARVPETVRGRLQAIGHELVAQETTPGELPFARVSAIAVAQDGTVTAGGGPAWSTAVGGL